MVRCIRDEGAMNGIISSKNLDNDYLRKKLDIPHKLSEIIEEKDLKLDLLSKMALEDPSTNGNPKKLTEADMKIMYQHSMSGKLF